MTLVRLPPFDYALGAWLTFVPTNWDCNTAGVQAVLQAVISQLDVANSNSQTLVPYAVRGVQYGVFKTTSNLSFLNVFNAGHQIPAYQPPFSLQAFVQTLSQQPS